MIKIFILEGFVNCSSKLFEKDMIFIIVRGIVGEMFLVSREMVMN